MRPSNFQIDPDQSPLDNLFYYLQDLEAAYDDKRADDDDNVAELISALAKMADHLLESGRRFFPQGQISTLDVLGTILPISEPERKQYLRGEIAIETLELRLLHDTSRRIALYTERLSEIVGIVRSVELHGLTRVYLEELSTLYLDGHDHAVYIVTRAALEESLKGAISTQQLYDKCVESRGGTSRNPWPELGHLVRFSYDNGILSSSPIKRQALDVTEWGNWAVHEREKFLEPAGASISPIRAIKSLAAILKDLSRRRN